MVWVNRQKVTSWCKNDEYIYNEDRWGNRVLCIHVIKPLFMWFVTHREHNASHIKVSKLRTQSCALSIKFMTSCFWSKRAVVGSESQVPAGKAQLFWFGWLFIHLKKLTTFEVCFTNYVIFRFWKTLKYPQMWLIYNSRLSHVWARSCTTDISDRVPLKAQIYASSQTKSRVYVYLWYIISNLWVIIRCHVVTRLGYYTLTSLLISLVSSIDQVALVSNLIS